MDRTEDVRRLIESRLTEIDEEARRLRRALEHLSGSVGGGGVGRAPRSARSPSRAGVSGQARGKRAARGERQRQLLQVIPKMRGASVNELADAMGIGSTQVHGLARKAEEKGLIIKKGQGFEVIGS
jgi:hypothetical protein